MVELKVKIPFWYKPFIRFMPEFYENVPEEKEGMYTTRVDSVPFSFVGTRYRGQQKGKYKSLQKAYLRARWRALWVDFWSYGSDTGIDWVIKKL